MMLLLQSCCFQHLDDISSRKRTNKVANSRSWRSLNVQKYLKQSLMFFQPGVGGQQPAAVSESNGCHNNETLGNTVETNQTIDTVTGVPNLNKSKKRYFHCTTLPSGGVEGTPATLEQDESSLSTTADTPSYNPHLLNHGDMEAVMSHCEQLWASCQLEAACCYIYQCLQIESVLLPFCILQTNLLDLPLELQRFACRVKEQNEINALYACAVFMLVTGDFVGGCLLTRNDAAAAAAAAVAVAGNDDSNLVNIFMLTSTR
jgi:hypothetical protein